MDEIRKVAIERILKAAEKTGRSQLLESVVYAILREAGVGAPRFEVLAPDSSDAERRSAAARCTDAPGAQGAGAVVKILSPEILHKTEVGGIAFAPADPDAILNGIRAVIDNVRVRAPEARIEGVLICERIPYDASIPGAEMLLSLRQDPGLGPVVVSGIGGLLTEWYGALAPGRTTWILSAHDPLLDSHDPPDAAMRLPALDLLVHPSRLHRRAPIDPALFWRMIRAWADLAATFGNDSTASRYTLEEIEVNPLALVAGSAPVALDGIGRFSSAKIRPRRRRLEKVANLLAPRSVAVVGASGKAMNAGRIILRNLRQAEGDIYGRIYPVHPKERSIDSIPCVASIADLPERVDMAVVAVPAEGARDAIRAFVEGRKAHSIILIPGGFAETGQKGLAEEIIAAIESGRAQEDGGAVLCGGNCLGIVSKRQYNTFFLPQYKLPFHDAPGDNLVAISQSGAYLVTLTSNLDGMIFPKASISYGNQMDLTLSDFLEHYLDDPKVQVLACYAEGFQPLDGMRFVDLVREHRRRGRVVLVFKAGKTALGARAAASHTASLAGDYAVARALMCGAGGIVAETLNQFEDFTKVFTMLYDRVPGGRRVGLISNAGFECSAAMDALYDLELAAFSDETVATLTGCLPNIAHQDNPIDATPMATTEQFIAAVEAVLADPGVDAMVVSAVPVTPALNSMAPDPAGAHPESIYGLRSLPQELIRVFRATAKPLVVAVDSGRLYDDSVILMQRAGIPVYRKIDRATRALSRYCTGRMG